MLHIHVHYSNTRVNSGHRLNLCVEILIHFKLYLLYFQWGASALKNMLIVPPGSGIVHQVNLEYLARVVFNDNGILYPDSLVGTDSHTTMINGLGVVGWGKLCSTITAFYTPTVL